MTFCLTHDPSDSDRNAAIAPHPRVASRLLPHALRPEPVISLLLFVLDRHLSGLRNIQLKLKDCLDPAPLPPISTPHVPPTKLKPDSSFMLDPLADAVLTQGLDAAVYGLHHSPGPPPPDSSPFEVLHRRPFVQIADSPQLRPLIISSLSNYAQAFIGSSASASEIPPVIASNHSPQPAGLFLVSRRPSG